LCTWANKQLLLCELFELHLQIGSALDELSLVASTAISAALDVCHRPSDEAFRQGLEIFMSAALDHMTSSVSLINGRLPLDASDEALEDVAKCVAPRSTSLREWSTDVEVPL
jgi:hypothetical protein